VIDVLDQFMAMIISCQSAWRLL